MDWKKSSYCHDVTCVEWRKSSYSTSNADCVEVAPGVQVRDSKLGDASPVLTFSGSTWGFFLAEIRSS